MRGLLPVLLLLSACVGVVGELPAPGELEPVNEPLPAEPPPTEPPVVVPPPTGTGGFSISLSQSSPSLRLNDSTTVLLTLRPTDTLTGPATLSVKDLPAGVTATFSPSQVVVAGPTQVTLTLSSVSDAVARVAVATLEVSVGAEQATAPLTLTVQPELLVKIAAGVNLGQGTANLAAFGAPSLPVLYVAPGTRVTFINEDGVNHRVHSNGGLGLGHQPGTLLPNGGSTYTQTLSGPGTVNFNCHIHPGMRGQIVVKPTP